MSAAIAAARAAVNAETFGTPAWESAMERVRELVAAEDATRDTRPLDVILAPIGRGRYRMIGRGA
ncbi:hypothetical protein UFOVP326_63 [uncultured Caudovirales phage]|uniref:Uncharacterized protein n=1 Tax=uncultured Caudovirales phage TaxID=2100421 RepID=A0A6J5LTD4_9CAUD|nr:hypothetical protein UFOVP326_63 [uncultured Caudovirales phage]